MRKPFATHFALPGSAETISPTGRPAATLPDMRTTCRSTAIAIALVSLAACGGASTGGDTPAPAANPAAPSSQSGSAASFRSRTDLEKAADAGDPTAQFELGALHHDGEEGVPKDLALARQLFEKAAVQGEVRSQFNLGVMYYQGEGIPQDYAKAREWFTKASDKGSDRAQFNLGVMYYRGEGMDKDLAKAMDLFTKAARQGFAEAQFNLGVMYALGESVVPDNVQAYAWFSVAKTAGNPRAQEALNSLEKQMTPEQIAQGKELAAALQAKMPKQQG